MTGIGTIQIGHAAAQASSQSGQTNTAARDALNPGSDRTAQISQVASQKANSDIAQDDEKQRAVQIPKKTEAGFSSNQDDEYKDNAQPNSLNSKNRRDSTRDSVDLIA